MEKLLKELRIAIKKNNSYRIRLAVINIRNLNGDKITDEALNMLKGAGLKDPIEEEKERNNFINMIAECLTGATEYDRWTEKEDVNIYTFLTNLEKQGYKIVNIRKAKIDNILNKE